MEFENLSAVNSVFNYVKKSNSRNRRPKIRQQIAVLLSQQEPLSKEKDLYRSVTSEYPENLETWEPHLPTDFPDIPSVTSVKQTERTIMGGARTLFDAIHDGNVKKVKQLIANGEDINQTDDKGSTPLMESILYYYYNKFNKKIQSYREIIHELLSIPEIDVNIQDNYGHSALIQAVKLNEEEIVKELLKHPAINVNITDEYGLTALYYAIQYKNNLITLLREAGGKTAAEIPIPNVAHAVSLYVATQHSANRHPDTRSMVVEALFQQNQLTEEKVVYRGMKSEIPTNLTKFNPYIPKDFFSASESDKIASSFANSKTSCCMITIYLQPGVYVLDVHTFLKNHGLDNVRSESEKEWLVEGGGQFFADNQKTQPGFAEIEKGRYETYYFPPASRVLESVPNTNTIKGGRLLPRRQQQEKQRTFRQKHRKNESRKRRRTYRK